MARVRTLFHGLIVLTLVSAVAWQVERLLEDPTEDAFADADRRLRGEGPGERKTDRHGLTFQVPEGTGALRVGSVLDVDGRVHFALRGPHGETYEERVQGDTFSRNCCWQRIAAPHPGTWELTVTIRGEGAYVLGFYFEKATR